MGWDIVPRERDIFTHLIDSLHCTAETNTKHCKTIIFQFLKGHDLNHYLSYTSKRYLFAADFQSQWDVFKHGLFVTSFWCWILLNTPLILKFSTALTSVTPLYPGSHPLYLIVILVHHYSSSVRCAKSSSFTSSCSLGTLLYYSRPPSGHSHDLNSHLHIKYFQK